MFSQILRRVARSAGFACYLLVIGPLGLFLILEAFPGWLLPLMNTDAVPYYAVKSNYVPHPRLIFVRRTRQLSFMTGGEHHADYSDYAKDEPLWSYTATYNEHGFRTNSKPPPHEVLVIGNSFVEIGERDDRTFSEIVASITGMSTFSAGTRMVRTPSLSTSSGTVHCGTKAQDCYRLDICGQRPPRHPRIRTLATRRQLLPIRRSDRQHRGAVFYRAPPSL